MSPSFLPLYRLEDNDSLPLSEHTLRILLPLRVAVIWKRVVRFQLKRALYANRANPYIKLPL